MTTISFCIPTRNFGAFIGQTLEHLVRERGPHDDIVIVDGNSTDNTRDVVEPFVKQYGRIRFERQLENGGVDRDLARAVSLARGDFCWLFSADDGLVSGAIERARGYLNADCDVLLVDRIDCDSALNPVRRRRWFPGLSALHSFTLSDDRSLLHYLKEAESLGGLFSYVGSIIVRREGWNSVEPDETLWQTNYAHVGRLLALLRQGGHRLVVVPDALVLCRGDNDSFAQAGRIRRFMIDVDGYTRIGQRLFETRPDFLAAFQATFRRDHGLASLSGVRMRATDAQWDSVARSLQSLRYPAFTLWLASVLGRMAPLVLLVRAGRNAMHRLHFRPPGRD